MSIIISPLFTDARGALGGVVIYKACGQVRMRTKPFSFRDKKSDKQIAQRQKLKNCLGMYRVLTPFFACSWRLKAKDLVMNGCNLFIKENIHNFNSEGNPIDWANLKVTGGTSPFSGDWQVEQTSPGMLTLRWNTGGIPVSALDDLLQIGVYGYEDEDEDRKVLFRLSSVRAVWEEGECTFAIPANRDTVQLYACFKNLYSGAYTDSVYLGEW